MKKKENKFLQKYVPILAITFVITLLAALGAFRRMDRWAQDKLLQKRQALSGDIVVIGLDEKALSKYGPYQSWDRNIMASALEQLGADENNMPAVVAIDTLYAGHTTEEADARLVKAASKFDHIVVGNVATYGDMTFTDEDGNFRMKKDTIVEFEESFDDLKAVTTQGHINAMYDTDGIMRHALLYEYNGDQKVYSMAYEVAKAYKETIGEELVAPKPDKNGFFYIHYSGLPGDFYESISIADVIDGTIPPDHYAGKIVFIGPYAAALQDAYYTAIERAEQMFGVEIQANVVEAMLGEYYVTELPDIWQILILIAVCLVVGYFLVDNKNLIGASIIAVVAIAAVFGAAIVAYNAGLLIHVVWIPIGVAALYVTSIVLRYIAAALERARVTHTFQRYVAPEIVGELLKEGSDALELGGKMYDIAVLFVDVRGFTTMSESLDPPTVVEIINSYLTLTTECIMRYNGTLDKFVGDCTMAFWNAPIAQEDPVYLACKAAMDMVEGSKKLGEELQARFGRSVSFGIGVNYGPAVVGNIGAPQRMDYTAIGDTVNTSARLEANAPGGTIYISRSVADALGDRAKTTSLGGTIKLKGKAEGFEILTLDALD